ncbi:MAG: FtsX-like permease family protein, partial [Vicinamibacterales bacterium]
IGASRGAIRSLVMRDGVTLVLTGVAAGVPLAFAAGYVSRTLLFEMSPFDGQAAGAAGGLVMLAGVCGALMPAIRASRTEPAVAMRPE